MSYFLAQALDPRLWVLTLAVLLALRCVPLRGWRGTLATSFTAGMVFDSIQFRVGPPRLWDNMVLDSMLAALCIVTILQLILTAVARLRTRG
ncbi:hypothetical protein U2261_15975 [Achromobacter xylosoxidans]|uniref:hypothetical protein n=1 Tax=Achromobacter TaxID=222 RepID=UPI0006AC8F1B|nr:hypothetical protein [Achromobacter xylosoxidans]KOQ21551.1 membrane protein [Achromobacter xylosoxidans]KOQ22852.1 membrane protein [Achromobacter xylosoxidans]KOQ23183.1 membrane protein [Achromobacter xylosoxidans]KOQ38983.1 membrane protein [Achromobacter xylosoxidans]KOQ41352.1 membrane protein [Achromobacter xylosoxidans]